jgi:hypothetical protein
MHICQRAGCDLTDCCACDLMWINVLSTIERWMEVDVKTISYERNFIKGDVVYPALINGDISR